MAVQSKHQSSASKAPDFSNDFTTEQRHRFTRVANHKAKGNKGDEADSLSEQEDEVLLEAQRKKLLLRSTKRMAMKPIMRPKPDKPHTLRYVIWLLTFLAICLYLMFVIE